MLLFKLVIYQLWLLHLVDLSLQNLEEQLTMLETRVEELNLFYDELVAGNDDVEPIVIAAEEHVLKLRQQAENLMR